MKKSFDETLIAECAPVLAGIKPAGLFRYAGLSHSKLRSCLQKWNGALKNHGMKLRILKASPDSEDMLFYLWRADWVEKILSGESVADFLRRLGYTPDGPVSLLRQLSQRMNSQGQFPHEIGVFLGYPLEDVIGFIENAGKNYVCCGCWKCYGDGAAADEYFKRCRKCVEECVGMYKRGVPLAGLVAAM